MGWGRPLQQAVAAMNHGLSIKCMDEIGGMHPLVSGQLVKQGANEAEVRWVRKTNKQEKREGRQNRVTA